MQGLESPAKGFKIFLSTRTQCGALGSKVGTQLFGTQVGALGRLLWQGCIEEAVGRRDKVSLLPLLPGRLLSVITLTAHPLVHCECSDGHCRALTSEQELLPHSEVLPSDCQTLMTGITQMHTLVPLQIVGWSRPNSWNPTGSTFLCLWFASFPITPTLSLFFL